MYKQGDIILVGFNKKFAKIMRFFQSDPVDWGHAVIVGKNNKVYSLEIKMEIEDIDKYLKSQGKYKVFRYNKMIDDKRDFMMRVLKRFEDIDYGWKRLFLFFLDNLFGTRYFTKICKDKKSQVCSSFISWLYYSAFKIKFNGLDWSSCDPDDLDDHCSRDEDWTIVHVEV